MALISTILGTTQRVQFVQDTTGTVIEIECTLKEAHSREATPTEYEIEDGSTISDHIIMKPIQLEIEGIISDTPISLARTALTTAVSAVLPPVGVVGNALGQALFSALKDSKSPSVAAFGQLLKLQENKKPFSVLTSLQRYPNMWIKSLNVPRDASTGQVLHFNLTLVQLLIVSPQTVNIQVFKNGDLSAAELNKGKQESTSALLEKFKQGQAAFGRLVN